MRFFKNGFFYQLGRSLTKIIIGLVLFLIASIILKNFDFTNILLDVNALSPNAWYDSKLELTPVYIRDIQNHTTIDTGTQITIPGGGTSPNVIFGNSGGRALFVVQVPYMQSNYAYEIDLYTCSNNDFTDYSMPYALDYLGQSLNTNRIFNGSQQYENISGELSSQFSSYNNCRVNTFYLKGQTGIWLAFPIGINSNKTPGFTYFGYKFYNLGVNDSVLSSIVGSQSSISSQLQEVKDFLHKDANDIYGNIDRQTNNIINNQNSNNNVIVNNQNSNNNVIVNNQNSNTQSMISNNNSNFNQLNSNITDDSIDTSNANDFFSTDQFDVMSSSSDLMTTATLPFTFLEHITETTCTPLHLTMPFVNSSFDLPCMSSIYSTYFPNFLALYRLITNGIILYYCVLSFIDCYRKILDPTLAVLEVYEL